ncbi:MAG: hypothetical protein M9916_06520 [Crocinitomicaceae bacterium]|nr:hypothetical protein [Crocinitomicaceae bacterium]
MRHFTTFLSIQESAGTISMIGTFVVVAVVLFVVLTSGKAEDKYEAKKKVYYYRRRYFWGLMALAFITLLISFKWMPYSKTSDVDEEVVTVVGFQWGWRMVNGASKDAPKDMMGESEITIPAGKTIKFDVTSIDVNHNFAIYDKSGNCVTQSQAMPGYHNNLRYKFQKPGNYKILCLEYCGVPHAFMVGEVHVK